MEVILDFPSILLVGWFLIVLFGHWNLKIGIFQGYWQIPKVLVGKGWIFLLRLLIRGYILVYFKGRKCFFLN